MGILVFMIFGFGGWFLYRAFCGSNDKKHYAGHSYGDDYDNNYDSDNLDDFDSIRHAYDSGKIDDMDIQNMFEDGTLDWDEADNVSPSSVDFDNDDMDDF